MSWKLTDGDNYQYGMQVSEKVFKFREFDRDVHFDLFTNLHTFDKQEFMKIVFDNDEYWIEDEINLDDYLPDEVQNHLSAYYDGVGEVLKIYGADANWIIAECIFEQESGLY